MAARLVSNGLFVGTGAVVAAPFAAPVVAGTSGKAVVTYLLLGSEVAHLLKGGTEDAATVPSEHIPGQEPEGQEPTQESAPFMGPPTPP